MFKKLFGALTKSTPAKTEQAPAYEVPAKLPALDPNAEQVTARMQLPDSIKKYMTPRPKAVAAAAPAAAPADTGWALPDAGEAVADAGEAAAAEAVDQAAAEVGEALADTVEASNGESAPFLGGLLKDPRFALISVKFLAFGLSKEAAVLWAAESASLGYAIQKEQNPAAPLQMSPEEELAVEQARLYAEGGDFDPAAATKAAHAAGFDKPAAMAAQAAAWSAEPPAADPQAADGLVGNLVNGAVLVAAAMTVPKPDPVTLSAEEILAGMDTAQELPSMPLVSPDKDQSLPMAKALKPFLDRGLQIAAMA